ncbi:MAG TPA: hypothetical protein VH331_04440 [Allosphingosinicella sp.]|nr:hypothetical protein [Allosphingosinicella sp.]
MADSKPYASLSSGLLARKGGAKPAMRPQGFNNGSFGGNGLGGGSLEDLGWNDLGPDDEYHHPSAAQLGLTPAPGSHVHSVDSEPQPDFEEAEAFTPPAAAPEPVAPPPVVAQQQVLRASFAEAEVVELPRRRAAPVDIKAKAAFTLRLDPERHLKLRLASAVTHQSAQQLVTAALDDFLNSLPGLDQLAERVPAEAGQRSR